MAGLIGFAPVYLNGLLALLFVFVLPGLVFVRGLEIASFPQRWFAIFLSSLTANHFLVTLIAALHLDPLTTYRAAAAALVVTLVVMMVRNGTGSARPVSKRIPTVSLSDISWLLLSLAVLGVTYINVWKHGVPNIFQGGDVSISWNAWALIWSHGSFPTQSWGYPQFVPTIWAVTYIFTGSVVQYFAYYIYIVLIIVPIALNAMTLGRLSWWHPLIQGLVLVWFVAEIQEPWLRSSLENGFPDWIAAIFAFTGSVLFVTSEPRRGFDKEKITSALLSLCLVSIAAATKPLYGLIAIAIAIAICTDAVKYLKRTERNRIIILTVGLIAIFVTAYALNYAQLAVRSMPNYPTASLADRMWRGVNLLNANFTLPFRILVFAGLVLCPFLARIRWLALPILIGFFVWATTASYDLRNLLGILLIGGFIPLYAAARAGLPAKAFLSDPRWNFPDGAVVACLAILSVGLTSTLAQDDKKLTQRFETEQLSKGSGLEFNRKIEQLLLDGCTVFSADDYIFTISPFQNFRDRMRFFHFSEPLSDLTIGQFKEATGCTAIFFPPKRTHPSILSFIETASEARGLRKVVEGEDMQIRASSR